MSAQKNPGLTIKEFLAQVSEPIRKTFAGRQFTVFGDVERATLWKDWYILTLIQRDKERTYSLTVWVGLDVLIKNELVPKEKTQVLITGTVSLNKRNEIQLNALSCEDLGYSKLHKQIDDWKKQYQPLFIRPKKTLPFICKKIGVISGREIQGFSDFDTHLLYGELILAESKMQGEGAAKSIIEAIKKFNSDVTLPDCIVITRGGGDFMNLFEFNMPILLEAISESKIPIISAVGHETDIPLCDYAADIRYSTPTDAGKELTKKVLDINERLLNHQENIGRGLNICFSRYKDRIGGLVSLVKATAEKIFETFEKNISNYQQNFFSFFNSILEQVIVRIKRQYEIITSNLNNRFINIEQQLLSHRENILSVFLFCLSGYSGVVQNTRQRIIDTYRIQIERSLSAVLSLNGQIEIGFKNAEASEILKKRAQKNRTILIVAIVIIFILITLLLIKK